MCQIVLEFENIEKAKKLFSQQIDRWWDWWSIYSPISDKLVKRYITWWWHKAFKKELNTFIPPVMIHERKASIGSAWEDWLHPFGDDMLVWQNWTIKAIKDIVKNSDAYSDTEWISDLINTVPAELVDWYVRVEQILDKFHEYWIIVIYNKVLEQWFVITDWAREIFVDRDDNKVYRIWNYVPWYFEWFDIDWWYLLDKFWNIIDYREDIFWIPKEIKVNYAKNVADKFSDDRTFLKETYWEVVWEKMFKVLLSEKTTDETIPWIISYIDINYDAKPPQQVRTVTVGNQSTTVYWYNTNSYISKQNSFYY